MAQLIFCRACQVQYAVELRGNSCPACGDELIHARRPAGHPNINRPKSPHASRAVWDHILKKDVCAFCSNERSTTIDHIQPKALGGSKGSWTNRTGSCFKCNQAKAHTPLLFFMLQQLGEDLSHITDEDGRWIIPDMDLSNLAKAEEETATQFGVDPRGMIFTRKQTKRQSNEIVDAMRTDDYMRMAEEVALANS